MAKRLIAAALALLSVPAAAAPAGYALIPGSFAPGRQPDGNTIVIDAPDGLIVVDTGRHPEHREKILALAKARGTGTSTIPAGMRRCAPPFRARRSTPARPSKGR